MKEYKLSTRISLVAILFLALTVLFLPEGFIGKELSLVLLDGGFASLLISLFSYLSEERKAIYNFYTASDRYAEKLRRFSQFLAEADVYIRETTCDSEKQRLMQVVSNRLETVFDKLYEEFLVIQKETREFESFSIKIRSRCYIESKMRQLYDATKDVLHRLNDCNEQRYLNELYSGPSYEGLKSVYSQLKGTFISYRDESKNEFELIQCKIPDETLATFVLKGYISLRKSGAVKRSSKYKVTYENKKIINTSETRGDMPPEEHSTRIQSPLPGSFNDEWIDDI